VPKHCCTMAVSQCWVPSFFVVCDVSIFEYIGALDLGPLLGAATVPKHCCTMAVFQCWVPGFFVVCDVSTFEYVGALDHYLEQRGCPSTAATCRWLNVGCAVSFCRIDEFMRSGARFGM